MQHDADVSAVEVARSRTDSTSVTSPPSFPPPDASVVPRIASAEPTAASKPPRSRWVLAVCAIGVVALVASTRGVFLGNRVTDWMNEPPSRSSDEAINVAAPRDAIERRIDIGAVADHVAPTIVTISADMDGGQSLGTGVIITTDGEILTNAHVVNGASSIRVRLAGETEPARGQPARHGRRQRPRAAPDGGRRLRGGDVRRSRQRAARRRGRSRSASRSASTAIPR